MGPRKFCYIWQLLSHVEEAAVEKICDATAQISGLACLVELRQDSGFPDMPLELCLTFTEGDVGERVNHVLFKMTRRQFNALPDLGCAA